jgi:hypothetical protein
MTLWLWYVSGWAVAGTIGWLAAIVHASGRAPLGLVSLVFGAILGATMSGIAASLEIVGTRRLLVSIVVIGLLTVLAEHAWLYLNFCRQWHETLAAKPEAALFRSTPPSPAEYFSHEFSARSAALWSLDALLIIGNAIAAVFVLQGTLLRPNTNSQSPTCNPKSTRHPTPDT